MTPIRNTSFGKTRERARKNSGIDSDLLDRLYNQGLMGLTHKVRKQVWARAGHRVLIKLQNDILGR